MIHRFFSLSLTSFALHGVLLAQAGAPRGGGAASPSAPASAPTTTRTPNIPTQPQTTQPNTFPEMQRPVYISGKVVLSDGTPPPESVAVQLVCNGSPRSVGYTDSKGRFSVDLTNRNNSALYSDASQSGPSPFGGGMGNSGMGNMGGMMANSRNPNSSGITERNLMGCDFQAYLAGFRSDQVNLSNRRSMDNPDLGTIVLHRLGNVEGLTISATSALAPKDARKAYDKAKNEAKKGKWENAEREYEKAVEVYPKYATAWYELGVAQQQQNNLEGARKSYAQAIAADPKLVTPYQQLAVLAAKESKWDEVAANTEKLLKLNPIDFPQAWFYNALAKYRLQNFGGAEESARKGLDLDKGHRMPKMDQLLGVILAEKRDYPGAAEHLNNYLKFAPESTDAAIVKKQLAEIQKQLQATTKAPAEEKP